jgi:hypothetical protein
MLWTSLQAPQLVEGVNRVVMGPPRTGPTAFSVFRVHDSGDLAPPKRLVHYANRAKTTSCGQVASEVASVGRQGMLPDELEGVTCASCRAALGLPPSRGLS